MRFASILLLVLALSAHARADEDDSREIGVFMPHYGYDIVFVATSGALYFTGRYAITPRDGDVAPLDGRGTHRFHRGADVASDVTVGLVLYGVPLLGFLLDGSRDHDYVRALRVPIVLFESFAMTYGITTMIKNAGVCRPYSWQPETRTCGDGRLVPDDYDEQRRSFPSGHASSSAAISGALFGMWLLPSGRDDRLAPLALGTTTLAIVTSFLRVRAGAHSLADIGTGFGIGFATGVGTAAIHLRGPTSRVRLAPMANGLLVHGEF